MFKKILLKYKLNKANYKWLKISKDIINEYRYTTKKNRNIDDFNIQFKLVRAFYSGYITSVRDKKITVEYGYLRIKVDKANNRIIEIHNSREKNRNGSINMDIKNTITSIYVDVFGGIMNE
jgi:hypothetical protein